MSAPLKASTRRVPRMLVGLLWGALVAQLIWRINAPSLQTQTETLPAPPPREILQIMSLGEPAALSRLLSLWLQAFDYQAGVSMALRELDYSRVIAWLRAALDLDPRSDYPLLAATHLYAETPDPVSVKRMLEFVAREFREAPSRRWRWLAHAVIIAKHRLGDLDLALRLAEELARHANNPAIPEWATQLRILVLEDMGEYQAAATLLGGLMESGAVRSSAEAVFLLKRLRKLEKQTQ